MLGIRGSRNGICGDQVASKGLIDVADRRKRRPISGRWADDAHIVLRTRAGCAVSEEVSTHMDLRATSTYIFCNGALQIAEAELSIQCIWWRCHLIRRQLVVYKAEFER